jgi:hypothetical protein
MTTYIVRYTLPNDQAVYGFRCEADSYEHAEEQFSNAFPDAILINIEEPDAPDHKANH